GSERGGRGARPPRRAAQTVDNVLEPHPAAALVELLARARGAAERAERGVAGGVAGHPLGDDAIDLVLDVSLDLVGKVFVGTSAEHHASARNVSAGSIRDARRAGRYAASAVAAATTSSAKVNARGSISLS